MTIILFIIIFGVIVLAHEFGHFIIAKKNGIHVVEFSIGMGPKIFCVHKNGTDYALRLLPIGGACMFEGEDGLNPSENGKTEGAFNSAPVWVRIASVAAGPFLNFVLAFFFGIILVWATGTDRPVINGLIEGYPAMEAGLLPGDEVIRMNGTKIYVAREIYINTYINGGKTMTIDVLRDGEELQVTITPQYNEEEDRYLVGFAGYGEYVDGKNLSIFKYAYYEVRYGMISTIKSLGMLVSGNASKDDISGPIGIAQVIGEVSEAAAPYGIGVLVLNMINIAMLLSVNLGVLNLLPLPALDGGRLVFLLIEAIRGKAIPAEKEGMVHFAGFVALMILMVVVMYNDIIRLFS
ncbi:MAG: RIP metalloprotease RseP [Lachnospiraceae bacterium]